MGKKILKWVGIVLGVIVAAIVIVQIIGAAQINAARNQEFDFEIEEVDIPAGEDAVAEGERLSFARGCADCHGADMSGTLMSDDAAFGTLVASNLTTGDLSAEDLVRAIRHGIGSDGKALIIMPSNEYYYLSDADVGHLVAYIQSLEPVDNDLPATSMGPLARVLVVMGADFVTADDIDHDGPRPADAEVAASAEFGEQLSNLCIGCHGEDFSGGPQPGADPNGPEAANLTPDPATGLGDWSEEDFITAIRDGVRPDGSVIDPAMPWPSLGKMTDTELSALWLYLQTVQPVEQGE